MKKDTTLHWRQNFIFSWVGSGEQSSAAFIARHVVEMS